MAETFNVVVEIPRGSKTLIVPKTFTDVEPE